MCPTRNYRAHPDVSLHSDILRLSGCSSLPNEVGSGSGQVFPEGEEFGRSNEEGIDQRVSDAGFAGVETEGPGAASLFAVIKSLEERIAGLEDKLAFFGTKVGADGDAAGGPVAGRPPHVPGVAAVSEVGEGSGLFLGGDGRQHGFVVASKGDGIAGVQLVETYEAVVKEVGEAGLLHVQAAKVIGIDGDRQHGFVEASKEGGASGPAVGGCGSGFAATVGASSGWRGPARRRRRRCRAPGLEAGVLPAAPDVFVGVGLGPVEARAQVSQGLQALLREAETDEVVSDEAVSIAFASEQCGVDVGSGDSALEGFASERDI